MTIDQVVDLYEEELENWDFFSVIDNERTLMKIVILLYVYVIIIGI